MERQAICYKEAFGQQQRQVRMETGRSASVPTSETVEAQNEQNQKLSSTHLELPNNCYIIPQYNDWFQENKTDTWSKLYHNFQN